MRRCYEHRAGVTTGEQARAARLDILNRALFQGAFGQITETEWLTMRAEMLELMQAGNEATQDNTAALQEQTQRLEEMNGLLKEQLQAQQALTRVSQSQYGTLQQAIADVASGVLGGRIGLGFQSPAAAGSLARY